MYVVRLCLVDIYNCDVEHTHRPPHANHLRLQRSTICCTGAQSHRSDRILSTLPGQGCLQAEWQRRWVCVCADVYACMRVCVCGYSECRQTCYSCNSNDPIRSMRTIPLIDLLNFLFTCSYM